MLITLTTTKKRMMMMMMMTNMMNVRAVMIGIMVSMAVLAQVMGRRCEKKNNKTKAMPMIRMTAHFGAFLCHW